MSKKVLCLFDVDGTLTKPRQVIEEDMMSFLKNRVKPVCAIGLVGGSDLDKAVEQMGGKSFNLGEFDYMFPENGLVAYKNGKEIAKQSLANFLGEEKLQKLINYCLRYMSDLVLPVKRGTFIEFRTGLINICPVGRSCSSEERQQFAEFDAEHKIREKFVQSLEKDLSDLGLKFSIGGQISIDAFPIGWDKTYCLRFVEKDFDEIHFFGDKTSPGGNDYEIFIDPRVKGHSVTSHQDTKNQLQTLFGL
ncbi:phosphomannomutase isoform X2 [Planococcus citri]